nr:MAG TPA: hypothetical protein [Caudoviricetes sp.]
MNLPNSFILSLARLLIVFSKIFQQFSRFSIVDFSTMQHLIYC